MLFRPFRTIARCWLVWRKTTKNKLVYQRGRLLLQNLTGCFSQNVPSRLQECIYFPEAVLFSLPGPSILRCIYYIVFPAKKHSMQFLAVFGYLSEIEQRKRKLHHSSWGHREHPTSWEREKGYLSLSRSKACQSLRPNWWRVNRNPLRFPFLQTILDLLLPLVAKAKNILKEGKEANKVSFFGILVSLVVVLGMKPRTFLSRSDKKDTLAENGAY